MPGQGLGEGVMASSDLFLDAASRVLDVWAVTDDFNTYIEEAWNGRDFDPKTIICEIALNRDLLARACGAIVDAYTEPGELDPALAFFMTDGLAESVELLCFQGMRTSTRAALIAKSRFTNFSNKP
jgi:hypothetical protein